MDILRPGKAHSVANSENVQIQNVVHEERWQIIHFPSNGNEQKHQQIPCNYMGSLISQSLFPVITTSIDTHTHMQHHLSKLL
jgi:hypothetical protein